jgi:tetratricopeptide (TPR) repeat protein/DNA-binding winged helix-turn-helix (wHTH) protein
LNSELLQGFTLDDWLVEPLKGQVTGAAGSKQHLPPKSVEVLLCLAKQPNKLVTREELLTSVWGSGHGSQESLGHAISEIRHAFDDHRDNPHFIQTLPKRGYRLLVTPMFSERAAAPVPEPTATHGWWARLLRHGVIQAAAAYLVVGWLLIQIADTTFARVGLPAWSEQFVTFMVIGGFPLLILLAWFLEFVGGRMEHDSGDQPGGLLHGLERNYLAILIAYGLSAAGAGVYQATAGFEVMHTVPVAVASHEPELIPVVENSIAVLRLATFDDDAKTKAFSDGLSEDILDGLARIPGLFVSSRGDSWSLPANSPSEVVRQRLRVANYIEGSVRFLDEKLKVVIQLIDSETGFHSFSRSFEIETDSVGKMQRDVTELVVANLKLAVDTETLDASVSSAAMTDRDAYLLYMLGREAEHRPRLAENIDEAINYYNQALEIDSDYPAAHAGLCSAHVSLYESNKHPDSITMAEDACSNAMRVAPGLPVVLNSVGRLYRQTDRRDKAEQAYLGALAISEQDAIAMLGLAIIRRSQQRYEEAEELMQHAIKLQPGNWKAINRLGNLYFRMGQFAAAATEYRKVVFLDPDNFVTLGNLASTSLMAGEFAVARDALLRSIEVEENATLVANLGIAYYYLGELGAAVSTLQRSAQLAPNSNGSWISLGDALHVSGNIEDASAAYAHAGDLAAEQLSVSGDDADLLTTLAWSKAMTGDIDRAVELSRRAVAVDPANPYSHYYMALVDLRRGDDVSAIDSVRLALENGYPVAMLAAEPILKELWQDSRFVELLAKHRVH